MLGTPGLLTFAFRALVLILLVSMLWIGVAERYNEALVSAAAPFLSGELTVRALGSHLLIEEPGVFQPLSIDGLTLHYGLVLMTVLVLAAVGIGAAARIKWLALLGAGSFTLHVVGVVLLARGVAWSLGTESSDESGRLVFSLFAVFWGLLPAVLGGLWCVKVWLPSLADRSGAPVTPAGSAAKP